MGEAVNSGTDRFSREEVHLTAGKTHNWFGRGGTLPVQSSNIRLQYNVLQMRNAGGGGNT